MTTSPTITVIFDYKNKAKAPTDRGTVSIQIYANRRRKIISTGVVIERRCWSPTVWVIDHPQARQLNRKIERRRQEIVKSLREGSPVNEIAVDKSHAAFLNYMEKEIKSQRLAPHTIRQHLSVYRALEQSGYIKQFADVTPKNIRLFMQFVSKKTVSALSSDNHAITVPIMQTSVYKHFAVLRKYIRIAQARHLLPPEVLTGLTFPRGQSKPRQFLTATEINTLITTPMPTPHLAAVRDLFIIQSATGLSYTDLMHTDFSAVQYQDGIAYLTGRRDKTGRSYFIVILPFALDLIKNLTIPRQISNQKYNAYLHEIQAIARINKPITSHIARHTYACLSLAAGVRMEALQRTLGHASLKTTQIYAQLLDQDVIHAFRNSTFFNPSQPSASH